MTKEDFANYVLRPSSGRTREVNRNHVAAGPARSPRGTSYRIRDQVLKTNGGSSHRQHRKREETSRKARRSFRPVEHVDVTMNGTESSCSTTQAGRDVRDARRTTGANGLQSAHQEDRRRISEFRN